MKYGRRPTRRQREMIKQRRLDPHNWLIVKDTPTEMVIAHRVSGLVRVIRKAVAA